MSDMTLIRADGVEREVDGKLTLESLQFLVGGYVEHIPLADGRHMFLDEDGKSRRKPLNQKATALFYPTYDHIVGDVLILSQDEYERMVSNIRTFKPKE